MSSRKLISVAVGAACAVISMGASAQSARSWDASQSTGPVMVQEVMTPSSVDESRPSGQMPHQRAMRTAAGNTNYVSLPNPQTPMSPNESGPVNYNQELRERAQHVASVEQTRMTIARVERERVAAIERERAEAAEQERQAAVERERQASLAAAPEGANVSASAPAQSTSTPVDSAATVSSTGAASSSIAVGTNAPAPAPAPQREVQANPSAALVDTRSIVGTNTAPQESGAAVPPMGADRGDRAGITGTGEPVGASSATAGSGTVSSEPMRNDMHGMRHDGSGTTTR